MIVINRQKNQSIVIGNDIIVTVIEVRWRQGSPGH